MTALLAVVTAGCYSFGPVPTQHVVMFDNRGKPLDPRANLGDFHFLGASYDRLSRREFRSYLDGMFGSLENWHTQGRNDDPLGKKKVLIFIHGGLNTQVGTVERVVDLHQDILDDGYYPIFVNWESSLFSSYWDHLWSIRQGKDLFPWGSILAPYYLLQDLTRGVVRLPITMYFQLMAVWEQVIAQAHDELPAPAKRVTSPLARVIEGMRTFFSVENAQVLREKLEERFRESRHHFTGRHDGAIAVSHGEDRRETHETVVPWFTHIITLPTKLASAALIEAGGKSAWDNMVRSVRVLFHRERDFYQERLDMPPSGGLSVFLSRLSEERAEDLTQGIEWELTLVGHSMGTIVLNETIREFPDLSFDRIVYMAAACSVRDYQDTLFPYLKSPAGEDTEVFHLTLHEIAEAGERPIELLGIDPAIRGSLLIWVDGSFSNPQTHLDMTAGRFNHLLVSAHLTPESVRGRIHFKSFDVGGSEAGDKNPVTVPQTHGGFTSARFWKRLFQEPDIAPHAP